MERSKLTDKTVRATPVPASGERIVWDADVQGLGLRLRSTGSKTWLLKRGSRRWSLGNAGDRSVGAVRGEALGILAELAAGREPGRKPRAGRPKVSDLLDAYLAEHVAKRRTDTTLKDYRRTADLHIVPRLGSRFVDDVGPILVDRLLADMRKTPAAANKATALLKAAMQWGMRAGYRAPALGNPCMGAELHKLEERGQTLEAWELELVLAAVERVSERPNRWYAAACLRLLALTGCRRDEIRALEWSWIDRERRRINWPRTKTGKGHLTLHAAALAVLEAVERRTEGQPTPHVFHGLDPALVLPRATLYRAWSEAKVAAVEGGVEPGRILTLRPHDLRHSFATLGLSHGLSLEDVGRLLRHRDTRTTKRYARHLPSRELALADQSQVFLPIGKADVDGHRRLDGAG